MITSIVISSFDAFGGSRGNNSRTIAEKLVQQLKRTHPALVVKHCPLRTVYDLGSEMLIDCVNAMPERPQLVISLGEAKIPQSKLELVARNLDNATGADNDGIRRTQRPIVPGGEAHLGLSLPYHRMVCGLSNQYAQAVSLSRDAGTFVCNNTAYLFRHHMPDISYGFIHVPRYEFRGNARRVEESTSVLHALVQNLIVNASEVSASELPEVGEARSWPTSKDEAQAILARTEDPCSRDFLNRLLRMM